jgi:hypothetical protein
MRKKIVLTTLIIITLIGVSIAAQKNLKLYLDGKLISSDIKIIDGKTYVSVKDIAKALDKTVVTKSDGYDIVKEGGTYQIDGVTQGKVGDELFTGKWKFQVIGFEDIGTEYTEKYYQSGRKITPQGKNDTLLVIHCKIKNGLKKTQSPILTERIPGNTALADENGQSYQPLDYDARQAEDKTQSYEGASLLPGAGMEFNLIFSVPKDTKPKSLIFTLMAYPDDVGSKKLTDVRVEFNK